MTGLPWRGPFDRPDAFVVYCGPILGAGAVL